MNEILRKILDRIGEGERDLGMDWRTSWTNASAGEGGALEIEFSRKELMHRAAGMLEGFERAESPEGEISLRSPEGLSITFTLCGRGGGSALWAVSSVADIRRGPEHSSELLTQAIMGERMTGLQSRGDWHLVKMDDQYHGWVRSWNVAGIDESQYEGFMTRADGRISASVAYVLSEPRTGCIPVSDVVSGTPVIREGNEGDFTLVVLPGGRRGFIGSVYIEDAATAEGPARERIIRRAEQFIGIPYIWGGTSAKGFDCSGLVKRVYLVEGIELPRDSDQQSAVGEMIRSEDIAGALPADLLYFGEGGKITHVAINLGGGRFIHAYGDVRINSLAESDPLYEGKLAEKLLFGRRVVEG